MDDRSTSPWYRFGTPDEATTIYSGPCAARVGESSSLAGTASVSWRWRRTPRARIDFHSDASLRDWTRHVLGGDGWKFSFEGPPRTVDPTSATSLRATVSVGDAEDEVEVGSFADVVRVEQTVANLRRLRLRGPTVLEAGGWRITIEPHPDDATKWLEDVGGYGPTHLVHFERADRSPFGRDEFERIDSVLWHFLGFVTGRLPAFVLPVAFDHGGEAVWTAWRSTHGDSWQSAFSWFDHLALGDEVPGLFTAWWERWDDEFWGRVLARASRMLVSANHTDPLDQAVATAWTLLETLAWAVVVVDLGWATPHDFERMPSPAVVRLLLGWCGIELTPPASLSAIATIASGDSNLVDAVGAVGWVRNRLAHPPKKADASWPTSPQLMESWRLATQWSDLVMLRLLGYQGGFGNRHTIQGRWHGSVEPVPWALSTEP